MAGSVNKVIIVGNLGRDPEVRTMQSGSKIVNLSVATSESWTDRASGERKERSEWHKVVLFDEKLGEVAEKYLRKGSKVYLEGTIETRKFTDKAGAEKYTTEIVLRPFKGGLVLLDSRGADNSESHETARSGAPPQQRMPLPARGARIPSSDIDSEIPFRWRKESDNVTHSGLRYHRPPLRPDR